MTNPHGVSLTAATGRYRAEYKGKYLAEHDTPEEAELQVILEERVQIQDRLHETRIRRDELFKLLNLASAKKWLAKED